jgi:hypothetical protein
MTNSRYLIFIQIHAHFLGGLRINPIGFGGICAARNPIGNNPRGFGLVIAQNSARGIGVVTNGQASYWVKPAARIPFDTVINQPALATIGIIDNGGLALAQRAFVKIAIISAARDDRIRPTIWANHITGRQGENRSDY